MTAKEKAKELFKLFDIDMGLNVIQDKKRFYAVKNYIIITIDASIKSIDFFGVGFQQLEYWLEVKQEIETL